MRLYLRGEMGAWWEMRCEHGHGWSVYVQEEAEPAEEQLVCKEDGLPAVTAARLPLADRAEIRIVPATWERDGKTGRTDEYFFEIRPVLHPEKVLRSGSPMSWDDAIRCAAMFRGIPWSQAERRWRNIRVLRCAK